MSPNDKPWSSKWTIKSDIGRGGQGTTYLVESVTDARLAVMKVLRNQKNPQARRRMFQEVSNLKVLESAGCKVPVVLDSNVQQFEANDLPLYFVMQHVSGKNLAATVDEQKSLGLPQSISLIIDLTATMRKAAQEGVLHRDLKPENIIVRTIEPADAVIVDYGLSFNDEFDEGVTNPSETLDNKFLSLPERRVPGGNRRDPRSDVTGVCALLYYCITGSPPVDLVGPDGHPPHRRDGHSIRERLGADPIVSRLESFFDRGFNPEIDNRFQSFDAMEARLREVINPALRTTTENPVLVAKQAADVLLKQDRKTQIAAFRKATAPLLSELEKMRQKYSQEISPFIFEVIAAFGSPISDVADTEPIAIQFNTAIRHTHNLNYRVIVAYQVRARAAECAVYRAMLQGVPPNPNTPDVVEPWQPLFWYQGLTAPDAVTVAKDFEASIVQGIRLLQQIIIEKRTKQ